MNLNNDSRTLTTFQSSSISDIHIGKAKKKEGFYLCPVNLENRNSFNVVLKEASIVNIKEISNTLIIKSKSSSGYMDKLNDKIVETVRLNSSTWFNSSIDDDVIEEYFISTLQYDKKNGETIRIKVKNIDELEASQLDGRLTLVLTLKHIKFFRQKFFPEFQIESITSGNHVNSMDFVDDSDNDDFDVDDEEVPLPSFEEVQNIKKECLENLEKKQTSLKAKLTELQESYTSVNNSINLLQKCNDIAEIIKCCEEYQNFICD